MCFAHLGGNFESKKLSDPVKVVVQTYIGMTILCQKSFFFCSNENKIFNAVMSIFYCDPDTNALYV